MRSVFWDFLFMSLCILLDNLNAENGSEVGSSCDLTHACDINCCSDPNCSEEDKLPFKCGLDTNSPEVPLSFCINEGLFEGSFFCPMRVNSAYLGLHYGEVDLLSLEKMKSSSPTWKITRSGNSKQDFRYGSEVIINGSPLMVKGGWGPLEGYCPPGGSPLLFLVEKRSVCFTRTYPCPLTFQEELLSNNIETTVTVRSTETVPLGYIYVGMSEKYSGEANCKNVVLSVEYMFVWKGSQVLRSEVDVLVANRLHGSSHVYIKQKYSIAFKHAFANETDLDTNSTQTLPGYRIGDSIIFS